MTMSQGFKPAWGVLEPKLVTLVGKWAIGNTGAVGAQTGGNGLSLVRDALGTYHVQILGSKKVNGSLQAILNCTVQVYDSNTDGTANEGQFVKMLSITDSSGQVAFQTVRATGAVAEAPSGAVISVKLTGRLSSAR